MYIMVEGADRTISVDARTFRKSVMFLTDR